VYKMTLGTGNCRWSQFPAQENHSNYLRMQKAPGNAGAYKMPGQRSAEKAG
jgi:hypothetical protein